MTESVEERMANEEVTWTRGWWRCSGAAQQRGSPSHSERPRGENTKGSQPTIPCPIPSIKGPHSAAVLRKSAGILEMDCISADRIWRGYCSFLSSSGRLTTLGSSSTGTLIEMDPSLTLAPPINGLTSTPSAAALTLFTL